MRVVLATSNAGKAREASEILAGTALEIVTLPLWLGDVETGTTYLENARLKAGAALRMLHEPILAEDAGLEIDALNGLPGVHSARFSTGSAANNAKVLHLLADNPHRSARFHAIAVLLLPSGHEIVGEGVFEGTIARTSRGTNGFGYDPLFIPDGDTRTAAELNDTEKNRISHRGQALRAVLAQL